MPAPSIANRLRPLVAFRGSARVLHLTTLAFFASFVVWFNLAPFAVAIRKEMHLTSAQMSTLALCNLAMAVPARMAIGRIVGHVGPRRLYAGLLVFAAIPNTVFAMAHSYGVLVLSRLAVGVVGAGFVVGIKMVAAWFPDDQLGTAEGVYGGWGNFGSAAAALALPTVATAVASGGGGWRWGVGLSGALAAIYGIAYFFLTDDAPGTSEVVPKAVGLRARSRAGALALAAMQAAVPASLGLVAWRVYRAHVIGVSGLRVSGIFIAAFFAWQLTGVVRSNGSRSHAIEAVAVAPVVVLSLAYGVTFGAELTMASLLPTFFASTFGLKIAAAGAAGSAFAFTNLVTRPGGGVVSDLVRSRRGVVLAALVGSGVAFGVLTFLDRSWPLAAGVAAVAVTSVFVQGGNGAIFAMVPLVGRRSGGQVAGIAGSWGNAGGVLFSSVLFFTANDVHAVFGVIGGAALVVAALCRWLPAPATSGDALDGHTVVPVIDLTEAPSLV